VVARERKHKRSTKRVIIGVPGDRSMPDIVPIADDAAAVADAAAAALRTLACATRDSLKYPGDVYAVLGSLVEVAARLPQSCSQMVRFLELEADRGRVIAEEGQPFAGEPIAAVTTAAHWLQQAGRLAELLRDALDNAQVATAGLAHVDTHDGPP